MNQRWARVAATAIGKICDFSTNQKTNNETPALRATLLTLALILPGCGDKNAASHEVTVPWGIGGQQLVADLHTHTRFSDGALNVDELVRKAYAAGCQVLAITDHSDRRLNSGTQAYLDAIGEMRKKYPQRILISGLEWNAPGYKTHIHMGVLVDTPYEQHLITFKDRFERSSATASEAFGWLKTAVKDKTNAAMIFHHPRREGEPDDHIMAAWNSWRKAGDWVIGMEGGPGHQNWKPNGGYTAVPTLERWDPAIARIGGAWDLLLERGENPWAAIAASDYHKPETEFTPCEFSRTVLKVPEPTVSGVLKALHAGSFWASQGRFIDYFLFTANAPGLNLPATPGEIIRARPGTALNVRVGVERSADTAMQLLTVEVIGNCAKGTPEILATLKLEPKQSEAETTIVAATPGVDGSSCYLRARVRGQTAAGEPALAHINPIRVRMAQAQR